MTHTRPMSPSIPATTQVLGEAEALSAEILKDIELSQVPLTVVVLKALRLARLLNDFEYQQIFEWESGGYPRSATGVSQEVWGAGATAGRTFFKESSDSEIGTQYIYRESIEHLEHTVTMGTTGLQAAHAGHVAERRNIRVEMSHASQRLASRRTLIYNYAVRKHYELKLAGVADDVFGRIRSSVDDSIGSVVPDAVRKLTAVYENLKSDNPEDWANATHSCRRVLQDLADAVFPAQVETRTRKVNGKEIKIRLGGDQYINRLMAFIEDLSESSRFTEIVGSHLHYIGDRLDALFGAAQKGSHSTVTKQEADRCVVYTYLLVGDILSLSVRQPISPEFDVGREKGSGSEGDIGVASNGHSTC